MLVGTDAHSENTLSEGGCCRLRAVRELRTGGPPGLLVSRVLALPCAHLRLTDSQGILVSYRLWCLVWASFNQFGQVTFGCECQQTPGRLWATLALSAVEAGTGPHLVGHQVGDRGPNLFWLWAAGRKTDKRTVLSCTRLARTYGRRVGHRLV